jgi:signal transduction histidine kinase
LRGDAGALVSGDNGEVGQGQDNQVGPAAIARRLADSQYAPIAAAGLLAVLAIVQAVGQPHASAQALAGVSGSYSQLARLGLDLTCLAATLPVGWLRGYPVTSAAVITAANVLSVVGFRTLTIGGTIAVLAALYWLGRTGSQLLAAGFAVPFLLFAVGVAVHGLSLTTRIGPILVASLGPMAAWAGAARLARSQAIEHDSAQQAIAGSLVEFTARGERARISRELHDVVAHHISMIAVQAETTRLATPGLPAEGAQRLLAIGDTARSALTEMRRLLGVLREDVEPEQDAATLRQPQPGLAQLNALLDLAREVSGSGIRLIVSGWPTVLDPGVELAAYRIVQEALSNARQHAPSAAVDVELVYADTELQVTIRDNGPGLTAGQAAGHGLLGMRERAAAVGGRLHTGSAACGGFIVEARLPIKAEAA